MDAIKTTEIARALYRAHGNKAEFEAAQCENRFQDAGDEDEADSWRAIRESIRCMRGANQS